MGTESVVWYAMTSFNTQHDLTSSFAAETLFSNSTHCTEPGSHPTPHIILCFGTFPLKFHYFAAVPAAIVSLKEMLNEILIKVFKYSAREKTTLRHLAKMKKEPSILAIQTLAYNIDIYVQTECSPPHIYTYSDTPPLSTSMEAQLAAHRQDHFFRARLTQL